jgi:hypothetical protein
MTENTPNAYDKVLTTVFSAKWRDGLTEIPFSKDELIAAAASAGVHIKNLADVLYTYPDLICRPIAIIRESKDRITGVEFEPSEKISKVSVLEIRRYRLVKDED